MAVAKAEWGTWFMMGALLGVAGVAGLVFCVRGFLRSGYRGILIAAVVLNIVVLLIARAAVFAWRRCNAVHAGECRQIFPSSEFVRMASSGLSCRCGMCKLGLATPLVAPVRRH